MPFAWDDYTARHTVEVAAAVMAPGGKSAGDVLVSSKRSTYSFDLDTFKVSAALTEKAVITAQSIAASQLGMNDCVL
jgi:hypothetical protein